MSVKQTSGGYIIDFTINHKRYREKIPSPHNKTSERRIKQRELEYQRAITMDDSVELEKYPSSKILQKAFQRFAKFTIDEYASKWFKHKQRNWSHTTIRGYTQKYNSYIRDRWGNLFLQDFKPSMFDEWASETHLSAKSINETRNVLLQIFARALLDEVITGNPIEKVQRAKQLFHEPEPFTLSEIEAILTNLETPFRQIYEFSLFTGLRTGEILGLRWSDIDLDKQIAHIRVNITGGIEKEPKTRGSVRSIELHCRAVKALNEILQSQYFDENRVFIDPRTGKTFKYADSLRKYVWKPALQQANVKYRYPYQCRHTYASMMLSSGQNPMWVAKQMGHSDWGMLRKTYGRWIDLNS